LRFIFKILKCTLKTFINVLKLKIVMEIVHSILLNIMHFVFQDKINIYGFFNMCTFTLVYF